jgi:hypothetical protein
LVDRRLTGRLSDTGDGPGARHDHDSRQQRRGARLKPPGFRVERRWLRILPAHYPGRMLERSDLRRPRLVLQSAEPSGATSTNKLYGVGASGNGAASLTNATMAR